MELFDFLYYITSEPVMMSKSCQDFVTSGGTITLCVLVLTFIISPSYAAITGPE